MKNRLLSLDIFRGLTIFLMIIVNTPGSWNYVYAPLLHAKWDGLTPTDLVFPFFVFIVGVAMSISFNKYTGVNRSQWVAKVLKRTALIFLVGLALNWFPFFNKSIGDLRIFGVLQRIALAYGFGSLIVIYSPKKWLPYVFGVLLVGYYAIMMLFGGADPLSLEDNASRALDLWLLGENHVYGGYGIPFDPEGLLSTIPTIGTVLFGYWMGKVIQTKDGVMDKIKGLLPYAIGASVIGVIWNFAGFPINKPIWSSSYVLVTGGLATFCLMFLMWILDEKKWQNWSYVFRAFGKNPLISYVLSGILIRIFGMIKIDGKGLYSWLYENVFQNVFDQYSGSFLQALTYVFFIWLFAWWMDRKDIVVKL
ncbi:MAG: heparan-alpha-glucosaminide N-acetyltransferase domain-containing protein [Saprospiraceae bacterium]|nr:heparan-alpha-glucosaminide N-acetyltransferase domain-containing protein [Saprospiraceae bacterium]|tara:strand:- start:1715 stop:2806 length:1092 start_codon:yes stop_codon:yes gene_type:complete